VRTAKAVVVLGDVERETSQPSTLAPPRQLGERPHLASLSSMRSQKVRFLLRFPCSRVRASL
jgi:hypothetical protein